MTIKQKIKKWQIVVIIILGIGSYWLSQNMWVFEEQIPVEEYKMFLIDTEWEVEKRDSIWNFNMDKTFFEMSKSKSENYEKGTWELKNHLLVTRTDAFEYTEWKIIRLTETEMIIKLLNFSPKINYKLIKVK